MQEFKTRGDLLEKQQLEYRAKMRIQEKRFSAFDVLLCHYKLLCRDKSMAADMKNQTVPPLRSVGDVLEEIKTDREALQNLIADLVTWLRVDSSKDMYWRYVAQVLVCMLRLHCSKMFPILMDHGHLWESLTDSAKGLLREASPGLIYETPPPHEDLKRNTDANFSLAERPAPIHPKVFSMLSPYLEHFGSECEDLETSKERDGCTESKRLSLTPRRETSCPKVEAWASKEMVRPLEVEKNENEKKNSHVEAMSNYVRLLLVCCHPVLRHLPFFREFNLQLRFYSSLEWLDSYHQTHLMGYVDITREFGLGLDLTTGSESGKIKEVNISISSPPPPPGSVL